MKPLTKRKIGKNGNKNCQEMLKVVSRDPSTKNYQNTFDKSIKSRKISKTSFSNSFSPTKTPKKGWKIYNNQ